MYRNVLINHSWLYPCDLTPDHSCQHVDHHGHSRGPLDRCLQSATLSACLHTAALQHCSRSPCVSWGSACWGLTGSCHWNCSSQCSVSAQWPASNIHQTVTTLAQCNTASILHLNIILNNVNYLLSTIYWLCIINIGYIVCKFLPLLRNRQQVHINQLLHFLPLLPHTSYLITTLTQCLCYGDDECFTFCSPQHNFPSEVDIFITLWGVDAQIWKSYSVNFCNITKAKFSYKFSPCWWMHHLSKCTISNQKSFQ